MGAQFAKERFVIDNHSLTHDSNSEPRHRRRFRRHRRPHTIRVIERRLAKRIHLMRSPKVRRELFYKLTRCVYPIKVFELRGKTDLCEFLKPVLYLFCGESAQIREFLLQSLALSGELEIVLNDLAQQARQEAQWQSLQRSKVVRD